MQRLFLPATIFLLVALATLTACSDTTPALEEVPTPIQVSSRIEAPASPDAPVSTQAPDGETHRRAQGDAGQSSDSRTNSNSCATKGTRSPPGIGHLCVALRTI